MITKTHGIVLRTVKYNDKSAIATVYTREFGRVSFIIHGVSRRKSAIKPAFFLPLSIVEINTTFHPGKEVQQLQDIRIEQSLSGIYHDPVKNAITLFLAELLYKTLRQPEADESTFDFLQQAIQLLDLSEAGIANFHLVFMIKLSKYLGFEPNGEEADASYFDLLNGVFLKSRPTHNHFANPEITHIFASMLPVGFDKMHTIDLSRIKRNELLNCLIDYYKLHMPDFHGLNATAVLHEIFN